MRMSEPLARDRLDKFVDLADYAVVGPTDNRVQEADTRRFPFNTICFLGRDFGDGRLRGCSGVLVAPRLVLTAAHCLYNLVLRRAPSRIVVMPGRRDRDSLPFGARPAARAYVPRGFLGERGRVPARPQIYDYGIVTLASPFRGPARFMPLHSPSDAALASIQRHELVTIAGYPGDRPIGTMWRHSERLDGWTARRLFYTVHTCPGHSGSPIWRIGRSRVGPAVIGVHTSGIVDEQGRAYGCSRGTILAPPGMHNSGLRVTAEIIADLRDPERVVAREQQMVRVL
jgi:V8-like Glu-specific endopeptidase